MISDNQIKCTAQHLWMHPICHGNCSKCRLIPTACRCHYRLAQSISPHPDIGHVLHSQWLTSQSHVHSRCSNKHSLTVSVSACLHARFSLIILWCGAVFVCAHHIGAVKKAVFCGWHLITKRHDFYDTLNILHTIPASIFYCLAEFNFIVQYCMICVFSTFIYVYMYMHFISQQRQLTFFITFYIFVIYIWECVMMSILWIHVFNCIVCYYLNWTNGLGMCYSQCANTCFCKQVK